jgi:hypothetical protein
VLQASRGERLAKIHDMYFIIADDAPPLCKIIFLRVPQISLSARENILSATYGKSFYF